MLKLKNLGNPPEFWEYFEQISKIPHCSGYEERIRNYIKNEAEKFNFETKIDKVGNILVRIPPKSNIKSKVILQSHLDMVCEKNDNTIHKFSTDSLKLKVIEIDGKKWVTADGTTLGADNGTGIASQLAIMKKNHSGELDFSHLGLDLLFTIDEEFGMTGAYQIDEDMINGNQLVNLDGIQDNVITIGSVGMIHSSLEVKLERININKEEELEVVKIIISGLLGGHSGEDINRGRANAIKLIARILLKLSGKYSIYINSINGGKADNAIPREANSIVYVKKKEVAEISNYVNTLSTELKNEFICTDNEIEISIQKLDNFNNFNEVFSKEIQNKILNVLYIIPNGPISMHPDIADLVFTSSNLGSITTKKNRIIIITSQRSFEEYSYKVVHEKITALFSLAELDFKFKKRGKVGSWNPDISSNLLKVSKDTYKELFNEDIKVQVIHATLETGLLKLKFPKIDIVSFSPKIEGAHSPSERLDVKSVEKTWKFLLGVLKNLNS